MGDNRVIFDLGGNKYRLIVHVSFAFGRVLVKFIGTHAEYDRVDPGDRVMAKKMIRPIRTETEYDEVLEEIEQYFENEPKPGTQEADRFDLLALIVEDYERKRWPIEPPETIEAIRYRMETGGYTQADLGRLLGSRQRASDILARKRPLTMRMAWKLHREWKIPAEALIGPPRTRGRKSAA